MKNEKLIETGEKNNKHRNKNKNKYSKKNESKRKESDLEVDKIRWTGPK